MAPADGKKSCKIKVPADRVVTDADALRWGTVSTIRGPLRDIARFAAFHLDLGAAEISIYLDEPDPETAEFLSSRKEIKIVQCDEKYWENKRDKSRRTHQLRQAFNATRTYNRSKLDWLCHIDVDEFLLTQTPIAQGLAAAPDDSIYLQMLPAELLAQPDPWSGPSYFKLTTADADQPRSAATTIYPEFGQYMRDGFISHTGGKYFARPKFKDVRMGIHSLRHKGLFVRNGQRFRDVRVGHAHAPTWEVFEGHMKFRMEKGSYRRRSNERMKLQDILHLIHDSEGTAGLRRFYDNICLADPPLLDRLAAHDMLLTATLDLDDKVARWFGDLPKPKQAGQ